jgi:hypothetical protein
LPGKCRKWRFCHPISSPALPENCAPKQPLPQSWAALAAC